MQKMKKTKTNILSIIFPLIVLFAVISSMIPGCGEDTTTNQTYIDNPNVKSYDSIGVEEHAIAFVSRNGIDLWKGETTVDSARNRDCSLADSGSWGENFYLQNGELDNVLPAGHESRWFRVYANGTKETFDTLSRVWGKSLDSNDFTDPGTESWGYFKYPLNSYPIFCFWLKGKKEDGTTTKNVYGLLQPRESSDSIPGAPYGYKMSFRVRLDTNGLNDFRKRILQE